jgi:hypothetical protein
MGILDSKTLSCNFKAVIFSVVSALTWAYGRNTALASIEETLDISSWISPFNLDNDPLGNDLLGKDGARIL